VGSREAAREALTGGNAGQPSEITSSGVPPCEPKGKAIRFTAQGSEL